MKYYATLWYSLKFQGTNCVCVYYVSIMGGDGNGGWRRRARFGENTNMYIIYDASLNTLHLWNANTPIWFSHNWLRVIEDGSGTAEFFFDSEASWLGYHIPQNVFVVHGTFTHIALLFPHLWEDELFCFICLSCKIIIIRRQV